jgi:saccharopine dehydrogenase (NAD+, L-lysine-forming)
MSRRALLYGATGFSGAALAEALADLGDNLLLGGRDPARLAPLAERLGLAWRAFPLDDSPAAADALEDVDVVLNAAGPFQATARPMLTAALATGTDYLDLAGEWPVFELARGLGPAALGAGVMLMPGVGFSIVAGDCLLAMAKAAVPGAVRLRIATSRPHVMSRGSVATALSLGSDETLVCRAHRLHSLPAGRLTADFDFGAGRTRAVSIPWPDVVSAPVSTGIGEVEAYAEAPALGRLAWPASRAALDMWDRLLPGAADAWQRLLVAAVPQAPPAALLADAGFTLVAEAEDPWRRRTTLRMRAADGYGFTTVSAAAILRRVLAGERTPGYRTPSLEFGARLPLELGIARFDSGPGLLDPLARVRRPAAPPAGTTDALHQ